MFHTGVSKIKSLRIIWLVLIVSTLTGCGLVRSGIAYFQSTEDFNELGSSGVFYEDGSKDHAVLVENTSPRSNCDR